MKLQNKLLLIAAFFVLALPMVLTVGTAQAAAPFLLDDGAGLKDNGQWEVIDPGTCLSNGALTTRATCNAEIFSPITYPDAATCAGTPSCTDGVSGDRDTCVGLAYNWVTARKWNTSNCIGNWQSNRAYGATVSMCSNPSYASAFDCTSASGTWQAVANNDTYYNESQRQQCLHCHNDAYGTHALNTFGNGSSQETYFRTGHRNVLRKVTDKSDLSGKIPLGGPFYTDDPLAGGVAPYTNVTWATGLSGTQTVYYIYNSWFSGTKVNQIEGDAMADPTTASTVTNFSGARTCFYCHTSAYAQNDPAYPTQEARYPLASETFEASVTSTAALAKFEIGITCVTCHKGAGNLWGDYSLEHHNATSTNDYGNFPQFEEGTALCGTCHRLEDTGGPITDVAIQDDALIIEELEDHHGNITGQFLQSPHAKFTGTYGQIQDPSMYASNFSIPGQACSEPEYHALITCTTNGGTWSPSGVDHNMGCQECHNPHVSSVDPETIDPTTSQTQLVNYCFDCHENPGDTFGSPQIVVADINHPTGPNTPLSGLSTQEKSVQMACIRCHMSDRINHLFKVNTDASYSTFNSLCSDPQYEARTYCTAAGGTWSNMSVEFDAVVPATSGFVELDANWACLWCHRDAAKVGASKVFNKAQASAAAMGMHGGTTGNCNACHFESVANMNHPQPAMFTALTCADCHTAPHDVGAPGVNPACTQCHGGGTNPIDNPPVPPVYWRSDADLAVRAAGIHRSQVDLVVFSISAPNTAKWGSTITVYDGTKNRLFGGAAASSTAVYLSADTILDGGDTLLNSRAVPALGPNATNAGSMSVTIPAGAGIVNRYLIWKADNGSAVAETLETNNTKYKAIQLRP